MNCKNFIFLVLFSSFITLYATEQKLLFFSPVIYQPVITLAIQNGKISANFGKILRGDTLNSINGKIRISQIPSENQKASEYEAIYTLSFSNVNDVKFILYEKNNCIMKVDKITGNVTEIFLRLIYFEGEKFPKDYQKKTMKTFFEAYSMEDYILKIYKDTNKEEINFEIVDCRKSNETMRAVIRFPEYSLIKTFSTQKDQITNSAWLFVKKGQPRILFSTTVHMDNYISEVSVKNEGKPPARTRLQGR